tara:strand:- start:51 stop:965 length:915 start_codon:yes stop_codon:yes gene_type:complete
MSIFKGIKPSSISLNEIEIYNPLSLDTNSIGIKSIPYRSGSFENDGRTYNISGSYWNSLFVNFYLSGSSRNGREKKYNFKKHSLGLYNSKFPQHKNKFHSSGSVIFIPQYYFGEGIRRESFKLVNDNGVTLKDDGYGNLYSTTTTHTSSATTSISSSQNYKGNIFYNYGVIALTDTGSYGHSGKVTKYTDLTTGSFTLDFEAKHTIFVKDYEVIINQGDFNSTSNPTIRALASCSSDDTALMCISHSASPYMNPNLTASGWAPYMSTIGFYRDNDDYPVMVARYPQPIKMRDDMKLIFRVRMDW